MLILTVCLLGLEDLMLEDKARMPDPSLQSFGFTHGQNGGIKGYEIPSGDTPPSSDTKYKQDSKPARCCG